MVVGFDKFKEYFESFRDEFIIIGGTAVQMVCGEAVAHPRVTKDIDVLVVSERMTPAFSAAFHAFLSAGRYSCYVSKNGKPHFYRFVNPKTAGFPEMIELLSSTELDDTLAPCQYPAPGFWRGGRGGDEGLARTRGGYLRKTWRNRGKNEVRFGVWHLGFPNHSHCI